MRRQISHPLNGAATATGLFRSFWMAGYESACHRLADGSRVDMIAATQHDLRVDEDYRLLGDFGIRVVREGLRWPLIERRPGEFDFATVAPFIEAAQRHGIQVIWNLCHYGWPDDLELLQADFAPRFAQYAQAVSRCLLDRGDGELWICPINEISFLSWAAGDKGHFDPFLTDRGLEVKRQLVRATLAACDAIWKVAPGARFVHIDPIFHVVPPRGREAELAESAAAQRASQFQAWDMIAGREAPELGGDERYLDVVGANFYHANEWEYPDQRLRWEDTPRDPRWVPLRDLLAETYHRYRRPLFLSETSHFGVGRGPWIREIAEEVAMAIDSGTPIEGVCLYPILDRPDWNDSLHWHNSGLWDMRVSALGRLERELVPEYANALNWAQGRIGTVACARNGSTWENSS